MLKFIKIIKIIFKTKFIFAKPPKKKIIIFDKFSEAVLKNFIPEKDTYVLNTRKETINLFIIYKMILSGEKINYRNYLKKNIYLVDPKFIITMVDNDIFFHELKKFFEEKIFIAAQGSIHFVTGDVLEVLRKKNYRDYQCDYYFVFSESYKTAISEYVKSKYFITGLVKNNFFPFTKNNKKNNLAYISRFPDIIYEFTKFKNIKNIKKKYAFWENRLLEFLLNLTAGIKKYCEDNNKIINVIGVYHIPEIEYIPETEYNFYKENIGEKNFNFIKRSTSNESYKNIDNFDVLINPMSTLGFEAIARGKKVAFFSMDHCEGANFGWPIIEKMKGEFFSNSTEQNEINRVINYLVKVSDDEWTKKWESYNKKYFYHDYDNRTLKDTLNKLIYSK